MEAIITARPARYSANSTRAERNRVGSLATCEHTFVGGAGSPYAAFRRALKARNVTLALAEARDMPNLNLPDVLELVLLLRDERHELFERAAVRFAGRYLLERKALLSDGVLLLGLLADQGEQVNASSTRLLRELVRGR